MRRVLLVDDDKDLRKCRLKTDAYSSLTLVMERMKDEAETGSTWY